MRTIERTTAFKRDFRREKRGQYKNLDQGLADLVAQLAADSPLPERYRDHPLSGDFAGYRDCHLRPDLVLIYKKTPGVLQLVRLGSHSELFE